MSSRCQGKQNVVLYPVTWHWVYTSHCSLLKAPPPEYLSVWLSHHCTRREYLGIPSAPTCKPLIVSASIWVRGQFLHSAQSFTLDNPVKDTHLLHQHQPESLQKGLRECCLASQKQLLTPALIPNVSRCLSRSPVAVLCWNGQPIVLGQRPTSAGTHHHSGPTS
jgi:hypothetical protein